MLIFFLLITFAKKKKCWLCTVAPTRTTFADLRPSQKIISELSEPRALNLQGDVEVRSVMLLRIVMMVLVGALCHQQGEWLGLAPAER